MSAVGFQVREGINSASEYRALGIGAKIAGSVTPVTSALNQIKLALSWAF